MQNKSLFTSSLGWEDALLAGTSPSSSALLTGRRRRRRSSLVAVVVLVLVVEIVVVLGVEELVVLRGRVGRGGLGVVGLADVDAVLVGERALDAADLRRAFETAFALVSPASERGRRPKALVSPASERGRRPWALVAPGNEGPRSGAAKIIVVFNVISTVQPRRRRDASPRNIQNGRETKQRRRRGRTRPARSPRRARSRG